MRSKGGKTGQWGFKPKVSAEWLLYYVNKTVNTLHLNAQRQKSIAASSKGPLNYSVIITISIDWPFLKHMETHLD
jgi:hypothetical protein